MFPKMLLLFIIFLFPLACATYKPEYIHKGFSYDAVKKGNIAIAAVSDNYLGPEGQLCAAPKVSKVKCSLHWAQKAFRAMKEERKDLHFMSPIQAFKQIGKDRYLTLLNQLEDLSEISPDSLAFLNQSLKADYIALIIVDEIATSRSSYDRRNEEAKETTRSLQSRRSVHADTKIYSVKNKTLVWSGPLWNDDTNTTEYTFKDQVPEEKPSQKVTALDVAYDLLSAKDEDNIQPVVPDYPSYPPISSNFEGLAKRFAEVLPEKD